AFWGPSRDDKRRGVLQIRNSDPAGAMQALTEAIEQAAPDTRIVVQSNVEGPLRLDPAKVKPGITLEGDPDKSILWSPGPNPTSPLIEIAVEGFALRGFTIDGNNQVADLVRLTGRVPGVTLSKLQFKGFKRAAVQVRNCQGDMNQWVVLSDLT